MRRQLKDLTDLLINDRLNLVHRGHSELPKQGAR